MRSLSALDTLQAASNENSVGYIPAIICFQKSKILAKNNFIPPYQLYCLKTSLCTLLELPL